MSKIKDVKNVLGFYPQTNQIKLISSIVFQQLILCLAAAHDG